MNLRRMKRITAFGILLPWIISTAFADAGVVGRDPVAKVSIAGSQADAKGALETGLPGAGGRAILISPHDYLGALLLPLRRTGILKELVVLVPHDNVLTERHLEELRGFLVKGEIPESERNGFRLENGSIRGAIEGMPVRIFTLATLSKQEGEFLVVLDTAFLPAVYKNEVKTPMMGLARRLMLTLADRNVRGDSAVLFDAAGRADFSLEHGYLAPLFREMLADPGAFASGLPEKWRTLGAAETAYFFSQYGEGMMLFRNYLREAPEDASACFKIAVMASRDLDPETSLHWLNRAADANPLYRRAFAEIAGLFFRREQYVEAEKILQGGLIRFPKDPVLASNLAAIYFSRGEAMREAGDLESAEEYYRWAAGVEGADPSIRERAGGMLPPPARVDILE